MQLSNLLIDHINHWLIKFSSCDLKLSGYYVHVSDEMILTLRNERIQVFDNALFIVAQEISFDN